MEKGNEVEENKESVEESYIEEKVKVVG